MSKVKFKIVTPDRVTYDVEADEVVVPTVGGQITILSHHQPLVTILKPGELVVKIGDRTEHLAVSHGVVEVRPGSVLEILADSADHAAELDLEKITAAKERAEALLKNRHDMEDVDFARAEAALERELARFKVAERHRGRRR